MPEPRLRFDRTAVALVGRLRTALAGSVPQGQTVIVTLTAPIRQDSKTGMRLQEKIHELLRSRRAHLKATIHGNRIEVRMLKGGARRSSRLIGFVHNPVPQPTAVFEVTRRVLACMGSKKRSPASDRWLMFANRDGRAPVETIRQVCRALRARTVFKRILVSDGEAVRSL